MRRSDKKKNIIKANLLAESRYLNGGEIIKEDAEEGKVYIDSWDNKQYSQVEVDKWIKGYQTEYRMPTARRKQYKAFFNRIGLVPKDYEKVKPKSILKLKKDGYEYYTEGVIDGHKVKGTFERQTETNGWCIYWYVNGEEVYSDCFDGGNFRQLVYDLDKQALSYIEDYKNGEHKKW